MQAFMTKKLFPQVSDSVYQGPYAFDRDLAHVPTLQRADAFGGAGGEDVAGFKGHDLGDERDEGVDAEDHVRGRRRLLHFAVDLGLDLEVLVVQPCRHNRPYRRERVEALGTAPLAVFDLIEALGDVVHHGDAEDRVTGFLDGQELGAFADDDGQFAFEFNVLCNRRRTISSPVATTAEVGFRNSIGSSGIFLPRSSAWSL